VFALLDATSRVIRRRRDDHVDILCPFMADHPDRGATGTALLPGGGIKCHHQTCHGRGTEDFITKLKELAAEDGLNGAAIYAAAFNAKQQELARADFEHADDAVLARLRDALRAGDADGIDRAAVAVVRVPRPDVLAVLRAADARGLPTGRVLAVLRAGDEGDARRAAAWASGAPVAAIPSQHERQVRLAAQTAWRARKAEEAWERHVKAARARQTP
jgi:hypothetical protein